MFHPVYCLQNYIPIFQDTPPVYNVSKMTTPTAFFYGGNDGLSNKTDVKALAAKISNLVSDDYIAEYNHVDFIFGIDAPKRLYNRILDLLEKFLWEEEWKCQVNYATLQASTININRQHNDNDNWMRFEWGFETRFDYHLFVFEISRHV